MLDWFSKPLLQRAYAHNALNKNQATAIYILLAATSAAARDSQPCHAAEPTMLPAHPSSPLRAGCTLQLWGALESVPPTTAGVTGMHSTFSLAVCRHDLHCLHVL